MKTKILHIIPSMSAGGIESLLVNVYQNIDRDLYHFDFAVLNPHNPIHQKELEKLNAKIYFLSNAGGSVSIFEKFLWRFKAYYNFYKVLNKSNYNVIHCHIFTEFGPYLLISKLRNRVCSFVVHSHSAGELNPSNLKTFLRRIWNFINLGFLISKRVGCSDLANQWLYGHQAHKKGETVTIYNGVDENKFFPISTEKKKEIKRDLNISAKYNFVNIGRFSVQKNQLFLLETFAQLLKNNSNIFLHIVGFGLLENQLKEKVELLNISAFVKFYDYDTNISLLLKVMDFTLLPSLWEGFPIVALESQFSNIPILLSDTVTKEVDIGLVTYLPIDKQPKFWSNFIEKNILGEKRTSVLSIEKQKLFEIKNIAKQFQDLYTNLIKKDF